METKGQFLRKGSKIPELYRVANDTFLHPEISYIHFDKKYAYATDSYCLIRVPISKVFPEKFIKAMPVDCFAVHRQAWMKMTQKQTYLIGWEGKNMIAEYKNHSMVIPDGATIEKGTGLFGVTFIERMDKMITDLGDLPIAEKAEPFGIDYRLLEEIEKSINPDIKGLALFVRNTSYQIEVRFNDLDYGDVIGLIMPMRLTNGLFFTETNTSHE